MPSNTSFYSSSGVTNSQTDATGTADNDNPSKTSFYSESGLSSTHINAIDTVIANAANSATASAASATASDASKVDAQTAEANAETAETNAETAQAASEAARDASIVAKDQSVVAKVASETAKTASQTAKTLAETAAVNAANSATSATSNGQVQVALATTQANLSTTKANEAAASASSINATELTAQANALAASQSAAAAATALDQFDDRYLGSKSAEPTLDNDGNALVQGALYFSNSSNSMQVYDGANWIAASSSGVSSLDQFEYTATASQTVFTGTDDHGLAMSFVSANILVTLNGIILDSSDYTTANGITITLDEVAAVGDLLNVYAFKSFQVADTVSASTGGTFNGQVTFGANATFNSNTTFGSDATFSDNSKLRIGNSGDMEMYHNGVNSFISDFGQGKLIFTTNGASLDIYDNANGHTMAEFKNNAGVKLKHQGSTKIETTATGVDISGNIRLEDNAKVIFGAGSDMELFHDGSNSHIRDNGTGNLFLRGGGQIALKSPAEENMVVAVGNGAVELYHNNVKKIETTASGISVSGTVAATTLTGDGSALTGIEGVPQGVIVMWSGQTSNIPTGWALCDGSNGTPNLIDKFIRGASPSSELSSGGQDSVTLSNSNIPSHSHSFSATTNTTGSHAHSGNTNTTGAHTHSLHLARDSYGSGDQLTGDDTAGTDEQTYFSKTGGHTSSNGNHNHSLNIDNNGNHSHSVSGTTGNTGSNSAFDNKPQYIALAYIMKT